MNKQIDRIALAAKGLLVLACATVPSGVAAAAELLTNGNLNTDADVNNSPDNWSSWTWSNDTPPGTFAAYKNDPANDPWDNDGTNYINAGNWGGWFNGGAGWFQEVPASAGTTYTFTSDSASEDWDNAAGELRLIFTDASEPSLPITLQTSTLHTIHYESGKPWSAYSLTAVAPAGTTTVKTEYATWGARGTTMWDNASLVVPDVWNAATGGDWFAAGNWQGSGVPNGVGATARLLGAIGGNSTVVMDSNVTLGSVGFDNAAGSYEVAGAGTLTLETTAGRALVDVKAGTHTINVPVVINSDTTLSASTNSTLIIADPVTVKAGKTLLDGGDFRFNAGNERPGTITYQSSITLESGAAVTIRSSQHLTALAIGDNATATMARRGSWVNWEGPRALRADTYTISASGGKLNLQDNRLITSVAAGTASGGLYSGVQGHVQSSYNFGAWDGPGLTTAMPDAVAGLTTIGVATGAQIFGLGPTDTATFSGQTINGATTVAMYTYAGDANLDGTIDGGDYGIIDNFAQIPSADGYANGDFNYDGVIDGGDYGIIDNNNQAQGAPFPTGASAAAAAAGLSGVNAVPEPSACGFAIFAATAAMLRRCRRARECAG